MGWTGGGLASCGIGRGRGRGIKGFISSELERLELRILSIEKASGFAGRGDGCVGKGSSGKGMLKNGRNKNGFGIDMGVAREEGGGDEMVEPEDE